MPIPEQLYHKIVEVMPIPCVDLLVTDKQEKVLLVKRKNEPAKGQWWFPGGRVHFGETRQATAMRILKEECNLVAEAVTEIGTYDVILDVPDRKFQSHGITTLFSVNVIGETPLVLDYQSLEADWRTSKDWLHETLHFFISRNLTKILSRCNK